MKFKRAASRIMLVLAMIMAVAVTGQGSASASTSKCYVKWPSTSCKTSTMRSNGTYHRIFYNMCAPRGYTRYADWQIKDADNGVIVGQGRVNPGTCVTGHINGLYGAYWGWVFNTRDTAMAYISNEQ